jgi:replicative DNA helicase
MSTIPNIAIESEEFILGSIILEFNEVWLDIEKFIKSPDVFYLEKHGFIFQCVQNLVKNKKPVDLISIINELKNINKLEQVGGAYFVSTLTNRVSSTANCEYHAAILAQKYIKRELYRIAINLGKDSHIEVTDPFELIEKYIKQISDLQQFIGNNVKKVDAIIYQIVDNIKIAIEHGVPSGITSCIENIDKYFSKQNQDVTIIAARPGMGKTAFMLTCAKNTAVLLQKPVVIFSLEMSAIQLTGRLMASEAQFSSTNINNKHLNDAELRHVFGSVNRLIQAPIFIDDTPAISLSYLSSTIKKLIRDFGIQEVYIDYLQLMDGESKGNREQEISFISRGIKKIAKECNIPITALSQLSRKVEDTVSKKPNLSHLRESGAIEQDADNIFFLMCPEYYGLQNEHNGLYDLETFEGKNIPAQNLMILDCAKYRNGGLFQVPLKFYKEFMQIQNYNIHSPNDFVPNALQQNNDFLTP